MSYEFFFFGICYRCIFRFYIKIRFNIQIQSQLESVYLSTAISDRKNSSPKWFQASSGSIAGIGPSGITPLGLLNYSQHVRCAQYFIVALFVLLSEKIDMEKYSVKFCCVLEFGILCTPIDTLQPAIEIRVTPQQANIALERAVVSNVEASRRRVGSNIGFGKLVSNEIFLFRENCVHLIHCLEYSIDIFFVYRLTNFSTGKVQTD